MFGLFRKKKPPVETGITGMQRAFEAMMASRGAFPGGVHRSFEEIQSERILHNWFASDDDVNRRLVKHLQPLRKLSRSLAESNQYAIRYLDLCETNIVGDQGFKLQSRVINRDGSKDQFARTEIESMWRDWILPENCTPGGASHWNDLERMNARTQARDGEVFLEVFPGFTGNMHRFALRAIDPEMVDVSLNVEELDNGNRIVMGKEMTPGGRCVAFYLLTSYTHSHSFSGKRYVRRPALSEFLRGDQIPTGAQSYILHQFVELLPGQLRGVPTMAAAIAPLRNLERTEEAHHHLARLSACMGYQEVAQNADGWDNDDDYLGESPGGGDGTGSADGYTDEQGFYHRGGGGGGGKLEIRPGFMATPGMGRKWETLMPVAPNTALPDHGKYTLQGTGMHLGVSYPTFSGNLEGTSYSSGRTGALAERDGFKIKQDNAINCRVRPVFHALLRCAVMFRTIEVGSVSDIGNSGERRLRNAHIQPRRWDWTDPLKDSMGKKNDLSMRVTSPQRVAAESGQDMEELLDQWKDYYEMLEDRGLPPTEFGQVDTEMLKILAPHLSEDGAGGNSEGSESADTEEETTDE